jgi:hypothetical protein
MEESAFHIKVFLVDTRCSFCDPSWKMIAIAARRFLFRFLLSEILLVLFLFTGTIDREGGSFCLFFSGFALCFFVPSPSYFGNILEKQIN